MDYHDPEWAADRLGIDKNTLYRFLQDGTIPALQLGRKWLVSERKLVEWLEQETDRQTRARRDATRTSHQIVQKLDQYTAAARQALKLAHAEARRYGHATLDQGHLLLGLVLQEKSSAARAISLLNIDADAIRAAIESRLAPSAQPVPRRLARTPDAKKAMRIASRLALKQAPAHAAGLTLVGSEHLLAGILLSRHGTGQEILASHGITRRRLREALRAVGSDQSAKTRPGSESSTTNPQPE